MYIKGNVRTKWERNLASDLDWIVLDMFAVRFAIDKSVHRYVEAICAG